MEIGWWWWWVGFFGKVVNAEAKSFNGVDQQSRRCEILRDGGRTLKNHVHWTHYQF